MSITVGELIAMSEEDRHAAIQAMTPPSDPSRKPEDWGAWGEEIDQHPICSPELTIERRRRAKELEQK